jgi:pimeloyl-ACP methyl ester carboxylesterase
MAIESGPPHALRAGIVCSTADRPGCGRGQVPQWPGTARPARVAERAYAAARHSLWCFQSRVGSNAFRRNDRSYADEPVTDEEWDRVYALFGIHLPDDGREAHTPKNRELGELDPVTPVPAAEEIVGGLPEGAGRLEVIEGAGHFTWLDAPDRFWQMLIDFVDGAP